MTLYSKCVFSVQLWGWRDGYQQEKRNWRAESKIRLFLMLISRKYVWDRDESLCYFPDILKYFVTGMP